MDPRGHGRRYSLLVILLLVGCKSPAASVATAQADNAVSEVRSGIAGTMSNKGSGADIEDGLVDGQILIWATSASVSSPTTTTTYPHTFGRPLESVFTTEGRFNVELEPGWYLVRATALGGEVCGEVKVEVRESQVTVAEFECLGP